MRRNLTGVRSGPSYARALSSAVVDEGTGAVTDVVTVRRPVPVPFPVYDY